MEKNSQLGRYDQTSFGKGEGCHPERSQLSPFPRGGVLRHSERSEESLTHQTNPFVGQIKPPRPSS